VRLPAYFSQEEIDRLFAVLEAAAEKDPRQKRLDLDALKFRHNLFYKTDAVRELLCSSKVVGLLTAIGGPDLWCRWDQTIAKKPGGEEFPWHQDNGYNRLLTEHYQFWVALTDMRAENGGLWVQPGSHTSGLRRHTMRGRHAYCPGEPDKGISIEALRGDVIVFSSYLLHMTTPNTTDSYRLAYVAEFMPMTDMDPGVEAPWLEVATKGRPSGRFLDEHPAYTQANCRRYARSARRQSWSRRRQRMWNRLRGKPLGEGVW
jgi:ectoine hydroxylase-related dioxygenase (phytanoyl-CoA dioxygenase family)